MAATDRLLPLMLLLGCGPASGPAPTEATRFLEDPLFRREVLEQSLVDPQNGYSALRLAKYATADGWDDLPVYNPPVAPVSRNAQGAFPQGPHTPVWQKTPTTASEWIALGRDAFERYPLSAAPEFSDAPDHGYGTWTDDRGRWGGLVQAQASDRTYLAKTCATCHARTDADGRLVYGASNAALDLGRARAEQGIAGQLSLEWGPGHVDPTADGLNNPTGITDLRPIRYQNHLNVAASIKNSPLALAVRVETLMITSAGQAKRPPRALALAIAYFLWSLGEPTAPAQPEHSGAALFQSQCSTCHQADFSTSDPVLLDVVGTEPTVGRSPMRGTGRYRIPSLFKVADRQRLLHHGPTDSLERLLDPERLSVTPGHPFGQALSDADKTTLIDYLKTFR